ncbi:hypothetical protein GSI_05877 [Ganoderma sinense ZZ0214-1]|uniref:Large ribosomal subunit protein uL23m n=1 Tax=Ganoderma sinense ZZ0214-1 TaxID=1077348 RepID=A0A2G8SBP6_9APHY|nr:hypothetical protein GSI_05877 [Ganoderma sinense ZZ0214-1]
MFPTLRRLYATIPDAAAVARTASTPRAVRIRRAKKGLDVEPLQSDATPEGLTPTEFARYQRALAKGELLQNDGSNLTEEEWLERLDARRSRVRGVRTPVTAEGEAGEAEVVGQKIFLPNIIFKLVRNHTPAGQPYNPYEATFRVPPSVTKTDVRAYLLAVYGVQTTYIRTDNYVSPLRRSRFSRALETITDRTYKRAVVGLVEPFYYPLAEEDMGGEERAERRKFLQERLLVGRRERDMQAYFLRQTKGSDGKGWKWRTGTTASRGNILRLIAERRAERNQAVEDVKARIREDREKEAAEAS